MTNVVVTKDYAETIIKGQSCDIDATFYNEPIRLEEITRHVRLLKHTSLGIDEIHNHFLKYAPVSFVWNILNLFNVSYVTGTVPSIWKEGIIVPILKPGEHNVESCKKITLFSCIAKLFEKVIKDRIEHYLEKINYINHIFAVSEKASLQLIF